MDKKEKKHTAPVTTGRDGSQRIVVSPKTYTAKYRDGDGVLREVATRCRDQQAARAVLQQLQIRADNVRSGLRTAAEDAVIDHQATPLVDRKAGAT